MKNRKKLEKIEISEVDKKNDTEERKLNKREFVTEELLKVFEDFRNKKINTEEIIKLFNEQSGELKYNKE